MPIVGFVSLCKDRAPSIVSRDSRDGPKHEAINAKRLSVNHYRIDGVVITNGERCDFAVILEEERKQAILIELKGSDLSKAVRQLETTQKRLEEDLKGYEVYYRIVANKCNTTEIKTTEFRKIERKWGKYFKYGTRLYQDRIPIEP